MSCNLKAQAFANSLALKNREKTKNWCPLVPVDPVSLKKALYSVM